MTCRRDWQHLNRLSRKILYLHHLQSLPLVIAEAVLREQGQQHKEAIWYRDADTAEKLDLVLFIGLAEWYPPQYDCGACGYGTCAEFMQANPSTFQLTMRQ